MSDILPFLIWFVPFALPGLANLRRPAFVAATAVFVLLAAGSIAIHAKDALWYSGYMWNAQPTSIDRDPARLWDGRDPAFLR